MLARVLEATELSTIQITLVREHTEKVKPPRALFGPFPYGLALGKPNDPEFQHRVLAQAFGLFAGGLHQFAGLADRQTPDITRLFQLLIGQTGG